MEVFSALSDARKGGVKNQWEDIPQNDKWRAEMKDEILSGNMPIKSKGKARANPVVLAARAADAAGLSYGYWVAAYEPIEPLRRKMRREKIERDIISATQAKKKCAAKSGTDSGAKSGTGSGTDSGTKKGGEDGKL